MLKTVAMMILTMLLSIAFPVSAEQMRPMTDAMADNPPEQAFAYAGRRCTALFLGMMTRYQNSGRDDADMKAIIKAFEEKYIAWATVGMELTMNESARQNSLEFFNDSVLRTAKAYGARWDGNFDISGNSFGEMTQADTQACNYLMDLIIENAEKKR